MTTPDFRYPHRVAGLRTRISTPRTVGETTIEPVDAVLVSHLENARYLTGFTGSNALVLVTPQQAFFFTDSRYGVQSSQEVTGFERVVFGPGAKMSEAVSEVVKNSGIRTLAFEAGHMAYNAFEDLKKAIGETVTLAPRTDLVEAIRHVKDGDEIAAMRKAIALADRCFDFICRTAKIGMTERELAWQMEVFMRTNGASQLAFDSIVGSGPNSALIHGRPSDRKLGESGQPEFLLCDFGCEVSGYNSDITRTFILGGEPTAEQRKIYDAVLQTERAAIEAIKPGVPGKDVDKIARDLLTEAGYGEAFAHSLGHGLGRVVHDHPALGQKSEVTLAPGMVVTVEPGAYIEGFGGVRIEDDVLVTETGCEILTQSPKELIVIG